MTEEWIIRVQGKEYGPVDLETLREWKKEGRVLPANEVRNEDVDLWTTADKVPGLFESVPSEMTTAPEQRRRSLNEILTETWQIYRKGFFHFLFLSALVVVPSVCGQLTSVAAGSPVSAEVDVRTLLAAMFNLFMLMLSLAAWPFYIAGIQILTSELAAGRQITIVDLAQRALKFWPRVALLWIFVCLSYFFWTALPVGIAMMVLLGSPSLLSIFFALLLLALQIYVTGRLFVNFMFWQQFAVLADADFKEALRQSKELARSRRDLPWFERPLWRGVLLASLWFTVVLVLSAGQVWSALELYFREMATATDPQALLQSMSEHAKAAGFNWVNFSLWLVQSVLRPLLGIAFVLLFFDSKQSDGAP
jgi:uncharacterized protein DUF4339